MMIFDYQCINSLCKDYHYTVELVVDSSDSIPNCGLCHESMDKVLTYSMAIVRNGTPIFHYKT